MRWTPSIMTGLACLATGLVAGYFLPRHDDSPSTDRTESSGAKRPAKTETVYAYNFPKTESASHQSPEALLRTIPPSGDYQARSEWLAKLPTSDLPQLVAGLCNDAGPEVRSFRATPLQIGHKLRHNGRLMHGQGDVQGLHGADAGNVHDFE